MTNYIFGEIKNVKEGDAFESRKELRSALVHRALVAGIDGNPRVGAASIVLNGGYVDDLDLGDEIIYTGEGGNDANTGKQVADQTWNSRGNKALLVSELQGLPVRVSRGKNHKSSHSPKEGYRFDGIYFVTGHFQETGKEGYNICRFKLEKGKSNETANSTLNTTTIQYNSEADRRISIVQRLMRDSKISKEVKHLYNYICQVCGMSIELNGIKYAEGAHIKPLGRPHNGSDSLENLLCLCPNHHVMFDLGAFAIDRDFSLVGIEGKLNINYNHIFHR